MRRPWYHESPGPEYFNHWTLAHVVSGMFARSAGLTLLEAVLLHTAYEFVEGSIFPIEHRDVSIKNHVGDSIAFLAGFTVGSGWPAPGNS
jgi:hypothetical protein